MKTFSAAMIATMMLGASASLYAQEPPTVIDQCPGEFKSAEVNLTISVSANDTDCPLLKKKELRKLVDKFGVGSIFAYPAVPGTCLSGTGLNGSIVIHGDHDHDRDVSIEVTGGYSESAQRLFPEAEALDGNSPLFINGSTMGGIPFVSGSAMTVVSLTGDDDFNMTLVLDDRFSINFSIYPFVDTEDFLIVGTKGIYEAKGRLNGTAKILAPPPALLENVEFKIFGKICLKEL